MTVEVTVVEVPTLLDVLQREHDRRQAQGKVEQREERDENGCRVVRVMASDATRTKDGAG